MNDDFSEFSGYVSDEASEENFFTLPEEVKVPAYTSLIYGDIYNNLENSSKLDSVSSARKRTFFQYQKLINSMLREIKMNQSVLQMGLTFGDEIDQVAQRIGAYGQFDVIDVNALQVARNKEKYGNIYPAMNIWNYDAAEFKFEKKYDAVICFFLLSELPPVTKGKVVNNALRAVKESGSAIFVDWHNPLSWHPLRYLARMHNRLYHPFAEKLWDREIDTFAERKTEYLWRKSTYFGRMFQKVVATRKENPVKQAEEMAPVEEEGYFLPDF